MGEEEEPQNEPGTCGRYSKSSGREGDRNDTEANPHPGQLAVHQAIERFSISSWRAGKTRLGVHECLAVAVNQGFSWWVAPTFKMAEVGWRPLVKM